jgi:hypothetical protein
MDSVFFFLVFIILPYSLLHISLASSTLFQELVNHISSLEDSTEKIFNVTIDIPTKDKKVKE